MSDDFSTTDGPVTTTDESSDGGQAAVASTPDGGRLTGAAPQTRPKPDTDVCPRCGCDEILGSIRIVLKTGDYCDGETFDHACADCGYDFSEQETPSAPQAASMPDESWICHECGNFNMSGDICPACETEKCAAPSTPTTPPLLICEQCGCDTVQCAAWVVANTNEILDAEPPVDGYFCPECDEQVGTLDDYGRGYELWREGELAGGFNTFKQALEEANKSERPFSIKERA